MKIIYIIDDLKVSGAQTHLLRLVNGLCQHTNVEVVALGPCSSKISEQFDSRVAIHFFDMDSVRAPSFWCSFFSLVKYLHRKRPDIVHTYLNTANVFGLLAARISGTRRVVTSRRDIGCFRTGRIAWLETILSRYLANHVFCVCAAVARRVEDLEKVPVEKLNFIYNGVDANLYVPKEKINKDKPLKFGVVASINREEKGHRDYIEAAAEANAARPGFAQFYLAGDGPLRTVLEDLVKKKGLDTVTFFAGEVKDIDAFLSDIDVLVVPSHTEGISNALLEGMAKGLPAIATAVDGNLEVMVHKVTGIMVPPSSPALLREAFFYFADNRDQLKKLGAASRARISEHFSLSKMVENYLKAYETLILK